MYTLGVVSGLAGLGISHLHARAAFAAAGIAATAVLVAVGLLELAPYEHQTRKQ
jgi:hypothetical protein